MLARFWVLILAAVLSVNAGFAVGQSVDPAIGAIVTLDQERFFRESAFGRSFLAGYQAKERAMIEENRQLFKALEAEELALTERRATMTAEAFAPLAKAFDEKADRFRKAQAEKERVLRELPALEFQRFWAAATPVLRSLMREIGAKAIINPQFVILGAENIDITDQAVARINQAFPAAPAP